MSASIGEIVKAHLEEEFSPSYSIREIVQEHIDVQEYDGLVNLEAPCGCWPGPDCGLMPCEEPHGDECQCGHLHDALNSETGKVEPMMFYGHCSPECGGVKENESEV